MGKNRRLDRQIGKWVKILHSFFCIAISGQDKVKKKEGSSESSFLTLWLG